MATERSVPADLGWRMGTGSAVVDRAHRRTGTDSAAVDLDLQRAMGFAVVDLELQTAMHSVAADLDQRMVTDSAAVDPKYQRGTSSTAVGQGRQKATDSGVAADRECQMATRTVGQKPTYCQGKGMFRCKWEF